MRYSIEEHDQHGRPPHFSATLTPLSSPHAKIDATIPSLNFQEKPLLRVLLYSISFSSPLQLHAMHAGNSNPSLFHMDKSPLASCKNNSDYFSLNPLVPCLSQIQSTWTPPLLPMSRPPFFFCFCSTNTAAAPVLIPFLHHGRPILFLYLHLPPLHQIGVPSL